MSNEVFQALHGGNTVIRVIHGRYIGGATGLDLVMNGQLAGRFYNPSEVTAWFEGNSKANVPKWKKAYHLSGLGEDDFIRPATKDIVLPVKYLSQRDNERHPFGTCNVTSYAMVMAYHGVKRKKDTFRQFEDELSSFIERNGRDRHVHDDLAWMGRQYGLNARFGVNRTWDEIREQIRSGNPVIVSGKFTRSGHIIVLIGTKGDDFIVHDPYGNWLTRYKDADGKGLKYPFARMHATVRAQGENRKWAHFISKP